MKYVLSKIANFTDLSDYGSDDWVKDDIITREEKFKQPHRPLFGTYALREP
ncbi:MAG: hypothetical protein ACI865_003442 [Flavobacteriaceae bacterium]|jgi:hypothetical protein